LLSWRFVGYISGQQILRQTTPASQERSPGTPVRRRMTISPRCELLRSG
jgi:hypothetical protein